ncbi:hypothetical protein H9P43_000581 [Blastocladiella emersonii ATCC 22665]|nr:hypothetical protein H9P43_000581 [Blastocladiella emersonii ATCC 22665]
MTAALAANVASEAALPTSPTSPTHHHRRTGSTASVPLSPSPRPPPLPTAASHGGRPVHHPSLERHASQTTVGSSSQQPVLPLTPPFARAAWTLRLLLLSMAAILVLELWTLTILGLRQRTPNKSPFGIAAVIATAVAAAAHLYGAAVRVRPRLVVTPGSSAGGFWPLVIVLCTTMVSSMAVALQAWLLDRQGVPLVFVLVPLVHIPAVILAVRGFTALKTVEMRVNRRPATASANASSTALHAGMSLAPPASSSTVVAIEIVSEKSVGVASMATSTNSGSAVAPAAIAIAKSVASHPPPPPLPAATSATISPSAAPIAAAAVEGGTALSLASATALPNSPLSAHGALDDDLDDLDAADADAVARGERVALQSVVVVGGGTPAADGPPPAPPAASSS